MDETCGRLTCEDRVRLKEREAERVHYSIIEDGPERFVLVDDRSEDPAPVFLSVEAAADHLEYLLK